MRAGPPTPEGARPSPPTYPHSLTNIPLPPPSTTCSANQQSLSHPSHPPTQPVDDSFLQYFGTSTKQVGVGGVGGRRQIAPALRPPHFHPHPHTPPTPVFLSNPPSRLMKALPPWTPPPPHPPLPRPPPPPRRRPPPRRAPPPPPGASPPPPTPRWCRCAAAAPPLLDGCQPVRPICCIHVPLPSPPAPSSREGEVHIKIAAHIHCAVVQQHRCVCRRCVQHCAVTTRAAASLLCFAGLQYRCGKGQHCQRHVHLRGRYVCVCGGAGWGW